MIVINDLKSLQSHRRPISLAAGFFDGVHRGHESIIARALEGARGRGGEAWVMTFDTHPLKILNPEAAPLMLTSTRHKLSLIAGAGVDGCILLPFTPELASTAAETFAQWIFHCTPSLKEVVVGPDWHFGTQAIGTPAMLADLGAAMDVNVITMPPVLHGDAPISSSRLRAAITHGNLAEATAMLGRPPGVLGTVVRGRAVGRTLGYPSANITPHNEALPPLGVYAVQVRIESQFYAGALNFGTRPTFDKDNAVPPLLELHVLDFSGSLYDQEIEAWFIEKLRDEWYFATVEELKLQISEDIIKTRAVLKVKGFSAEKQAAWAQQIPALPGPQVVGDTELESVTSCV